MKVRLGIDVACRADHQASLAGADGEFLWSGWRFRTTPADLEALWAKLPAGAEVQVVMEPTRNAWVPLAAWFTRSGLLRMKSEYLAITVAHRVGGSPNPHGPELVPASCLSRRPLPWWLRRT